MKLEIDNIISDLTVEVQKKKIKNIYLYVKPPNGKVTVSAPLHMSDDYIMSFIRSKEQWILKQRKKFKNHQTEAIPQYVTGETLYLWGEPLLLQVEKGQQEWSLELVGNKAILSISEESSREQREEFVRGWYRLLIKARIEELLPKWEAITGLSCSRWNVRYMTTRWGSCNTRTRKIWLNLQLAEKPADCLEYVILHELAHLKVRNHGPEFTAFMDSYMPDWRGIRERLNSKK